MSFRRTREKPIGSHKTVDVCGLNAFLISIDCVVNAMKTTSTFDDTSKVFLSLLFFLTRQE